MDKVKAEIEALLDGVTDESQRNEMLRKFFKKKSEMFASRVRKLSLEELDSIAGGMPAISGSPYEECEPYKSRCASLGIGVDICNTFSC